MLLRSASTPILNSWLSHSREASPETEMVHQIQKPRNLTLSACSSSLSFSPMVDDSAKRMARALSETDLSLSKKRSYPKTLDRFPEIDEEGEEVGFCSFETASLQCMFEGGCESDVGDGGVRIYGGGGGGGGLDGGDNRGSVYGDSDRGNDSTDLYYQTMIEANPENSLLLSNYARFLKEIRGDLAKAEEYCGRAILSNPGDGNTLSMYADLIWKTHKDASRAENYFDRAVKASPDDCYVLASYARFLWDTEEEKEEEKGCSPSFDRTELTRKSLL